MLNNRRNIDHGRQGKQPRQTVRATGAVVVAFVMIVARILVLIHTSVMSSVLLAISHVMAHLTSHVLGRIRSMPRQALGQRRNARPKRQAQHQQKMDKVTGHHCC